MVFSFSWYLLFGSRFTWSFQWLSVYWNRQNFTPLWLYTSFFAMRLTQWVTLPELLLEWSRVLYSYTTIENTIIRILSMSLSAWAVSSSQKNLYANSWSNQLGYIATDVDIIWYCFETPNILYRHDYRMLRCRYLWPRRGINILNRNSFLSSNSIFALGWGTMNIICHAVSLKRASHNILKKFQEKMFKKKISKRKRNQFHKVVYNFLHPGRMTLCGI